MGCTQSKQRTDAPAPASAPAPVQDSNATVHPTAAEVVAEPMVVDSPSPVQAEAPEQSATEAAADNAAILEAVVTPTETPVEPATQTIAADDVITSAEPLVVESTPAPIEVLSSAPAVPVLALPAMKKTMKKTTPRKTVSPRKTVTPQKENAGSKRATSKTPKRALGLANANTNAANATAAAARKVSFEPATAPVVSNTVKRNTKLRKSLGKHAPNVQVDMYASSIAAFERQLTHRGTLDKQLGTR